MSGNYSSGTLPSNTTDVQLTVGSSNATTALTDSSNTSLKMESLNVTDSSPSTTYTIANNGSSVSTLTLGNSAGFTNAYSGAANDLLYLQNTNLTITGNGTSSTLGLALASNGNFDVSTSASVLSISAVISGGFGITNSGAGTLILSGANTFSGSFTAGAGLTNLYVNGALGSVSSVSIASGAEISIYNLNLTDTIADIAAVTINGTLDTSGSSETVASISGSGSLVIGKYGTSTIGSFTVGTLPPAQLLRE